MSEPKSTKKPTEPGSEAPRGPKEKREFDAEMMSLIDSVRITPPAGTGPEQPGQTLNVQPPPPELVSRLVKFIKKI